MAQVAGHLGELLQGRLGPTGPVALITLPCPVLCATVRILPGGFGVHQPDGRVLGRMKALRFLRDLGRDAAGRAILRLDMPPGGGAGASTAALVALARAAGADEHRIAAACIAAEGASDPLMYDDPARLLWASRQGRVLQALPPLPRMEVIGGFAGAMLRTDAKDSRFADVSDLVQDWCSAAGDLAALARIASVSARRTLALRGPVDDGTEQVAQRLGAPGFAIAHTGAARALLFPPGQVPSAAEAELRKAGWRQVIRFRIGGRDGA